MAIRQTFLVASLSAIALLTIPSIANAGKGNHNPHAHKKNATGEPPYIKRLGDALKAVSDASAALTKAESTVNSTWIKLKSQFERSGELVGALGAQKQAQIEYDTAKAPILAKLQEDPRYTQDLQWKEKVEDQITAAANSAATAQEKAALAQEALDHGAAAHKLEANALRADANVSQAKGHLTQAAAKVAELRAHFESSFATNPEWMNAKNELDAAKQKEQVARATLSREVELANLEQSQLAGRDNHNGKKGGRNRKVKIKG